MDDWQFKIHYSPEQTGYALYMYRKLPDGSSEFNTGSGAVIHLQKGSYHPEPLYLAVFSDLQALKTLIDQADAIGIRPDSVSRAEGELSATKRHLFDMRAIVYKHEGLMFEADVKERPKV